MSGMIDEFRTMAKEVLREALSDLADDGKVVFVREDKDPYKHRKTLTAEEVSKRYGVSVHTLARWRQEGRGPRYSVPGRNVLYSVESLDRFFIKNAQLTVDDDVR